MSNVNTPGQQWSARLDHITVVAPNLEAGAAYVESALGTAPGAGRAHPHMATHNLLLALGPSVYLEVISPDPRAAPVPHARWFGLDDVHPGSNAHLAAWVASTDDIERIALPEFGEVQTMRRDTRTWKITVRPDGSLPLGGAAPLLIQRSPGIHPAAALSPSGLHLKELRIRHPEPDRIRVVLERIGLAARPAVTVAQGKAFSLVAVVQTPAGPRELGEV